MQLQFELSTKFSSSDCPKRIHVFVYSQQLSEDDFVENGNHSRV